MSLFIHRQDTDGQSGALHFHLQVTETDEHGKVSHGPIEKAMIYPRALLNLTEGKVISDEIMEAAINTWLESLHAEMILRKWHIETATRVGKKFEKRTVSFASR